MNRIAWLIQTAGHMIMNGGIGFNVALETAKSVAATNPGTTYVITRAHTEVVVSKDGVLTVRRLP